MSSRESEDGLCPDATPAPIRYRVEGDDRPFLAFRTQDEDGRLLLSLVVDKERQHAFDDVRPMFLDDPRLSVWEESTIPAVPPLVVVSLVREAAELVDRVVVAKWTVGEGTTILYPVHEVVVGTYYVMQDDELLQTETMTRKDGKIQVSSRRRHGLVPKITFAWCE